jgi:hypothetical protein
MYAQGMVLTVAGFLPLFSVAATKQVVNLACQKTAMGVRAAISSRQHGIIVNGG